MSNGTIRVILSSDPGVNPPVGRIFVWPEVVGGDIVFKYRDSNGVIGIMGTSGAGVDANAIHKNASGEIQAITEKTAAVSNDLIVIEDSENSYSKKSMKLSHLAGALSQTEIDKLIFNATPPAIPWHPATINWNQTYDSFEFHTSVNDLRFRIGQDHYSLCWNNTGVAVPKGRVLSRAGVLNTLPTVVLTNPNNEAHSRSIIGVSGNLAPNNSNVYVVRFGRVYGLDTSAFSDGDLLYGSPNGVLTNVEPVHPSHAIFMGIVLLSHSSEGIIGVNPRPAMDIQDLHDVSSADPSDGNVLVWNDSQSLYVPQDLASSFAKWENYDDGIVPVSNKNVYVGLPGYGRELSSGEGPSYTGTDKILIYTYDGSTYVDETAKAVVDGDSNYLTFAGVTAGNMIYIASKLSNTDMLKHPGVKINITTAAIIGTGSMVIECWNGGAWVELPHMATQDGGAYLPYGNEYFSRLGYHQYFYNQGAINSSVKNDPMSLGTGYYWVRWRIVTAITLSPSIDLVKLHTNRTKIGNDGFQIFYGNARPSIGGLINWGNFVGAASSPNDQPIYLSDNLNVGLRENSFANNAIDRIGFKIFAPYNICTSCPLTLKFAFFGDSNESQANVDFTIRWAVCKPTDLVYTSTAAPTLARGEQSISGQYPMPANSANQMQYVTIPLSITEAIAQRDTGKGDIVFVSFERQGPTDAYSGNIIMAAVDCFYTSWKNGEHL